MRGLTGLSHAQPLPEDDVRRGSVPGELSSSTSTETPSIDVSAQRAASIANPPVLEVEPTDFSTSIYPFDLQELSPVQRLIQRTLQDDERRVELLSLSEVDAQLALDELWRLLDHILTTKDKSDLAIYPLRNKLRRFSLKISLNYDTLPKALFLEGVMLVESDSKGIGGFSDVYLGSFEGKPVAIKRLRVYVAAPTSQKVKIRQAFCRESMLWKHLSHRHILHFLGVCEDIFSNRSLSMILPWMTKGCIRHYIDHLQSQGALVEENPMEPTSYQYASVHGGGAIRWQAPELIDPEEFGLSSSRPTFASDMYSFACICVELHSGAPPFPEFSDHQLMRRVVEGERPPRPSSMPALVWHLVTACWNGHLITRPSARQASKVLNRITLLPSGMTYGRYRPSSIQVRKLMVEAVAEECDPLHPTTLDTTIPYSVIHAAVSSFLLRVNIDLFDTEEIAIPVLPSEHKWPKWSPEGHPGSENGWDVGPSGDRDWGRSSLGSWSIGGDAAHDNGGWGSANGSTASAWRSARVRSRRRRAVQSDLPLLPPTNTPSPLPRLDTTHTRRRLSPPPLSPDFSWTAWQPTQVDPPSLSDAVGLFGPRTP
ncbi:hypothetical protein EIP91_007177 [Steccherinum ochraceum]|uniref:Serine-threonine/tyrosine-protein kinase catalytic domain-containing protein n=1 Tax=Steccherinum ochraceum TaxID=92696 RepID=A0A4R0RQS7_9APHY|nr:hypothetical protein EIP91_007177 [Steccherinum ochraceum]